MPETAVHLVENIIPCVKVRQYVLSVPIPLRYWMASDKKLLAKVHKIFAPEVERFYTDRRTKKFHHSLVKTTYSSQGRTTEQVIAIMDKSTCSESWHVALSRAKI